MSKHSQMGISWAATLIACVSLLLAFVPFIFYKYGPRIRAGSRFAPCMVSSGSPVPPRRSVHLGTGSQDRRGVRRREKKRGRGIDTIGELMVDSIRLLDIISV